MKTTAQKMRDALLPVVGIHGKGAEFEALREAIKKALAIAEKHAAPTGQNEKGEV